MVQKSVAKKRRELIELVGKERNSAVLTYFLSDRQNVVAGIADDAVRPMYDHLRGMGRSKKIDLFLYSRGGDLDVPWRIVTMIREWTDEFAMIIPYRAMSAATLIALGADEVVMGPKGELGPIDPQVTIQHGGGGTAAQQVLSVEDIMSYIDFLRERVGLTDQEALSGPINTLANNLNPAVIGKLNRIHSHIRVVARKMVSARNVVPEEQRVQLLIETLAEKTYQHGHAIGRAEAKEIGFNVVKPGRKLNRLIWELQEQYEALCQVRDPVDPRCFVSDDKEEHAEDVVMGCIETLKRADHFTARLRVRRERKPAPQLAANLNFGLTLPAKIKPEEIPEETQKKVNELLQKLPGIAQDVLRTELEKQMPTINFQLWTENGAWRPVPDWPPPRSRPRRKRAR